MSSTVQSRLYRSLVELIPQLANSRTHFAPARLAGDIAIHCAVDTAHDGHLTVEIAFDQANDKAKRPSAWICFDVDPSLREARVTRLLEGMNYACASGPADPAAARINLYAANWLTVFTTLGRVFEPIDLAVAI
ncbi:hypothetical protein [Ralstonia pseudosolanacearum]|jgi:hypothetical protein|uniref:Uncharacterized protein n=1 Tax=Ralstonia pseudosolanacearum TaxID=1310165 RepID=A0A454TM68_9RALS|nr:hypothetical protein [Ralstonia pseudosolanacearum]RNM03222.1 hypothetical protein EGA29_19250 [Ralstonia pseudosolanacearum]